MELTLFILSVLFAVAVIRFALRFSTSKDSFTNNLKDVLDISMCILALAALASIIF